MVKHVVRSAEKSFVDAVHKVVFKILHVYWNIAGATKYIVVSIGPSWPSRVCIVILVYRRFTTNHCLGPDLKFV